MLHFVCDKDLKDKYLEKKIFSALCAIFFSDTVFNFEEKVLKEKFIFWPDGISSKLIKRNIKNVPGRDMLRKLIHLCKQNNNHITFAGSPIRFNDSIFSGLSYNFVDLPFDTADKLSKEILKHEIGDVIVLCVSSPKQEEIASYIQKEINVPIYCFGAAINMLTGKEVIAPKILQFLKLEFVWRLATGDTLRRIGHLIRFPKGYARFLKFSE